MIIFSVSKETHVMQVRSMHKLISKLDIYSKSTNSQYPMITFTSKKRGTFNLSLPTNNEIVSDQIYSPDKEK